MSNTPLAVLNLVPISSGFTAAQARSHADRVRSYQLLADEWARQ